MLLAGVRKKFGIKNNFSSTPPSNLNYDWSLGRCTGQACILFPVRILNRLILKRRFWPGLDVQLLGGIMHWSMLAAPSAPPSPPLHLGLTPVHLPACRRLLFPSLFSPRDMANSRGWRRKMRANSPSSINTAAFFIDRTFEWCLFKHLTSDFFVSH